jgi:hypothetical protein
VGDRRSWVGGVVVHERGVRERGGVGLLSVSGRSSLYVGGLRSWVVVVHEWGRPYGVAGAGGGGSWWFGIVVRRWLLSVQGVGLVVHPWRGSSSSGSAGRGRRCPCVLVLRGRLSFFGGGRRRTWAVNVREWGGGQRPWSFPLAEGGVVVVGSSGKGMGVVLCSCPV